MPNDLTTTPSSTPARPTSPVLSPELTAQLDSAGSPEAALEAILASPALVEEARAVLPALKAVATAKAGPEGVRAVVGKRLSLYPQQTRTDGEWDAWWSDYFDVLSDVPLASLEAAMRAYVALPDSEFMPKPGRLRELAFVTPCRSLGRYQRALRAVTEADKPPPAEVRRADAGEVRRMLSEFHEKVAAPDPAKLELPSIAGKPDAGGLTERMRELMARRAEERRS